MKYFYQQSIIHGEKMEFKKSIIILIITIFLFSIASVCASDANTTATAMVNEQKNEEINDFEVDNFALDDSKILGSSAGNEILKESTTVTNHTFEAINSAIDEGYDTIYLEPGTYTGNTSIFIYQCEKGVNIIGNSTILDGQGMVQILFADNSRDIMLQNITFANGNCDAGGAILINYCDNVKIIDCTLINNTASQAGGAIMSATFTPIDVINCTFTNNKANNDGGAIYWMTGAVKIEGCIFTNNTADGYSIVCGNGGSSQITTSIFTNNHANASVYIFSASSFTINNNIFLNNKGIPLLLESDNADYNWFGHTENNYKEDMGIMYCSKWLFLNAKANPDTIGMSDTSNITFTIWAYDSSTNSTTLYDKNLLKPVDLKITAEKGNLSSNTAKFDETIIYAPNIGGNSSVTASIENTSYTIYINVNKGNPNLSLVDGEVPYSENTKIALNYNSRATGKVNITLTGKKHNKTLTDLTLNSTIDLESVLPDEYDVEIAYSGDESFTDAKASGKLTVLKIDSDIKVQSHDINVTDTDGVMFTVTLPKDATGNLTISNGKIIDVAKGGEVKKGKLIVKIKNDGYSVAEYEWTFNYLGDEIYKNSTDQATSNILIIQTTITPEKRTIEMNFDDESKIKYTTQPVNLKEITFESNNTNIVTVDADGFIKATGAGQAKITIKFEGNENYTSTNATVTVTVNKINPSDKISIDIGNITYGEKATVEVKLPVDGKGNVTLKVDGEVIDIVPVANGTASGHLNDLSVGNHTVYIIYSGDNKYMSASKTATITVKKDATKIIASNIKAIYNVNKYLVITLKDSQGNQLANRNVVVDLYGAKKYTTNTKGQVKIKVSNMVPKTYTAKISFAGDGNYIGSSGAAKVIVKKATPKLSAKTKIFKRSVKTKKYSVALKTNKNKVMGNVKLIMKVGKKTYVAKTNKKGIATFKITKLTKKGKYTAAITYKGNNFYNKLTREVKIIVK